MNKSAEGSAWNGTGVTDLDRTIVHLAHAVETAPAAGEPFRHLQLRGTFPEDVYAAMLAAIPDKADYRPMSGRARVNSAAGDDPTRIKMDLFPECIRHLPTSKAPIWNLVGRALRSIAVREAFQRRLAPELERRFGPEFASVSLYAVPILVRDIPGYRIGIHADTPRKGITVQLYLPRDRSMEHVGTSFHRRLEGKRYEEVMRMPFAPNVGYAFVVAPDTYHSVNTLGPEIATRDSILLNYFVDDSLAQLLHNRGKRMGNFLATEVRNIVR